MTQPQHPQIFIFFIFQNWPVWQRLQCPHWRSPRSRRRRPRRRAPEEYTSPTRTSQKPARAAGITGDCKRETQPENTQHAGCAQPAGRPAARPSRASSYTQKTFDFTSRRVCFTLLSENTWPRFRKQDWQQLEQYKLDSRLFSGSGLTWTRGWKHSSGIFYASFWEI